MNLNNDNESIYKNQEIFDSYNKYMFSNDKDIFNKMVMRIRLFDQVKTLHGDIVECGVFKGAGILLWLKLLNMHHPNDIKKVIGFDFFDSSFVEELDNDIDKKTMKDVFIRCKDLSDDDISMNGIRNKILYGGFNETKFELIKGDISTTSKDFLINRPGFRISLLYLDLDLEKPTYDTLMNLYDRVVSGGIIVFDEYGYHAWSESNAVDMFVKQHNLTLYNTFIKSPTAYIIKPHIGT
jgi:hypothetical protein